MNDELGGEIMKEFTALRAKTYGYLTDNNDEDKKAKGAKCVPRKENVNLNVINIFKSNSTWQYKPFRKK